MREEEGPLHRMARVLGGVEHVGHLEGRQSVHVARRDAVAQEEEVGQDLALPRVLQVDAACVGRAAPNLEAQALDARAAAETPKNIG